MSEVSVERLTEEERGLLARLREKERAERREIRRQKVIAHFQTPAGDEHRRKMSVAQTVSQTALWADPERRAKRTAALQVAADRRWHRAGRHDETPKPGCQMCAEEEELRRVCRCSNPRRTHTREFHDRERRREERAGR